MDYSVGLRARIDRLFERLARCVCRHPWATVGLVLGFAAVPCTQLAGLEVRVSPQDYLHRGDPIRRLFERFRSEFGSDQSLVVAVETADVFAPEFLATLRDVHHALERRVPHADGIKSLVNARWTRSVDGELLVSGLFDAWPDSPQAFAEVKQRIVENPLYQDTLVSHDGTIATILVEPDAYSNEGADAAALTGFEEAGSPAGFEPPALTNREKEAMVQAVREVLAEHAAPGLRFHLAGNPALAELNRKVLQNDLVHFSALSLAGILGVLYLLFRSVWAVVLPFFVVGLSLATAIGCMPLLGFAMMPTIQFMPSFLFCVGLCDSVHLLVLFFQKRRAGAASDEAVVHALRHSGLAILLTSLTTAGGLVAFAGADLVPVAFLGVIAPLGVMLAFGFSVTLLPALLVLLRVRPPKHSTGSAEESRLGRGLLRLGGLGVRRPWSVVLATAALSGCAVLGTTRLHFGHDPLAWFPPEEPLRRATQLLDRKLAGVMTVDVLVDAGAADALHEPELLHRLEAVAAGAAAPRHGELRVGKTVSIVDVVKEIHEAMGENRVGSRVVPDTREQVAQELLLFENAGSSDLSEFTDDAFRTARVNMKVPWVDASLYPEFLDQLQAMLRTELGHADFGITGATALEGRVIGAIISSTAESYVIAFLLITPMMVIYVGSLRRGLLSMLPNLVPILFVLGAMGWMGVPVDGASLMVGAIILGLSVDDTIHFMHKFAQHRAASMGVAEAVRETLRTTGMAMLFTTLVLAVGFFAFTSAYMRNMAHFGALTGFAALTALLADVLLAPALMSLAEGRSGGQSTKR